MSNTTLDDDESILKDGEHFHLPLHLKDAIQREITDGSKVPSQTEIERPCLAQKLPTDYGAWTPSQGTTETSPAVQENRKLAEQSHADYTSNLESAWQKPTSMWKNKGSR